MSFTSGQRQFTIGTYAQSGLVMDWFGLTDPFTQTIPLKVANAYSGSVWIQGQLNSPPSGYYSYSGVSLGLVNSGSNATLTMTWGRGVSGWIASSSPITDSLTLGLIAFTSSNYTGAIDSGTLSVSNTLFSRYSGVIKVFGDIYNNDQPTPTASTAAGGTLNQSGVYTYAISYVLSGWESDVSAPSNSVTMASGFGTVTLSWTAITGATAYYVWRWSGSVDFTKQQGSLLVLSGTMDLENIVTTNSDTDTGSQLRTGYYRHRFWSTSGSTGAYDAADASIFLTAPQSRTWSNNNITTHTVMLSKNASGINLLGPFYAILHTREATTGVSVRVIAIANAAQLFVSGTSLADSNARQNVLSGVWYRTTMMLGSSGSVGGSGLVHIQLLGGNGSNINVDDVFVCAVS